MRSRYDEAKLVVMLIAVLLGGALLVFSVATGDFDPKAISAMESAGYSDVVVRESSALATIHGCSKGDTVAIKVSAKNPAGMPTTATVCCGLMLKGCTIRH